jgi:hypothetical protein
VGIDAFIYLLGGKKRLQPVVEINARKTMSWVALQLPEKQIDYSHSSHGQLPSELIIKGKTIRFGRNIQLV